MKLQDKVAILTGAASGIGEAVAKRYLDEGAKVVVVDVKDEGELAQRFSATADRVLALRADVTKRDDIKRIVGATVERFGGIDILFNNAALFDMRPILDESWDVFDRLYRGQREGHVLPDAGGRASDGGAGTRRQDHQHGVAGGAARRSAGLALLRDQGRRHQLYAVGRAGAREKRINVNGIAPGVIDTPMWEQVDALFAKYENRPLGEKKRVVGEEVPLGRMGLPADLTGAALFLASPDSDYITAQTLNVDGGNWMS